ncbi:hypothetical protein UMZ34_25570 [Halopseudomonas pachastrellae]|nr:hypothetical protein UMZ34_25570 [Halopseudomonas pachastrellae]
MVWLLAFALMLLLFAGMAVGVMRPQADCRLLWRHRRRWRRQGLWYLWW